MAAARRDYARAAEYLDLRTTPERAEQLATQLAAVLNAGLPVDLESISRNPEGDLRDSLPNNRERVGSIKTKSGALDIQLTRSRDGEGIEIWLFSSETLRQIPNAFQEVNLPAFVKDLPSFLRHEFLRIELWRWLMVISAVALSLFLGSLVSRAVLHLARPVVEQINGPDRDRRISTLKHPLQLVFLAVGIRLYSSVSLSLLARDFWVQMSRTIGLVAACWMIIRFAGIGTDLSIRRLLSSGGQSKIGMLVLLRRAFNIFIVLVGAIILLRLAGVDVTAVLAGLGLGGIALALSAQKTLENILAGIALILREAMRVGDFCTVANCTGTVEDIGFGSTRIRTLSRTLVSIPNAQIGQSSIENYTWRDKFWIHHELAIASDTSADQMRAILKGITEVMLGNNTMEPDSARVRFVGFGPSSLNLEVFGYARAETYERFLQIQEEMLLHFMDVVAGAGARMAIPSQVNYLKEGSPLREISGGDSPNSRQPA